MPAMCIGPGPVTMQRYMHLMMSAVNVAWLSAGTAAVNNSFSGGKAVHYFVMKKQIGSLLLMILKRKWMLKTKAIVIINPNNPTGAVYSKELLQEIVEIARQNNLIIFADEIYDKILYDGAVHHHIAALAPDLLTVTLNGLSKLIELRASAEAGWFWTAQNIMRKVILKV